MGLAARPNLAPTFRSAAEIESQRNFAMYLGGTPAARHNAKYSTAQGAGGLAAPKMGGQR